MPDSPVDVFIEAARSHNRKVVPQGSHFLVSCPGPNHAHGDRNPSLHVSTGRNGGCALKCFAGCDNASIVDRLGLKMADLFVPDPTWRSDSADPAELDVAFLAATYSYVDVDGTVEYQVLRVEHLVGAKTFTQRRPNGHGGWINNLEGVTRLVYRLPELRAGIAAGSIVWYVEGEKDAETLARMGYVATTAGAVNNWRDEMVDHFEGCRGVRIVADRDGPGYTHARRVAAALDAVGIPTKIVEAAEGKDVTDHVAAGLPLGDLRDVAPDAVAPAIEVADETPPGATAFETAVAAEVLRLAVRREAARQIATEGAVELPRAVDGASLLAVEDDPLTWRIADLLSAGDNVLMAAERKAGKSTLALNLAVSVLRGEPFLDRATTTVAGRVAYWDAELGRRRFRSWLRAIDVADEGERLSYRDFRALPFPAIFDDVVAANIVDELRAEACALWIIDPAVHAIARWPTTASSAESDNVTVTQFTNRLDEIKNAAGVGELVVVHHAGKDGTGRGRGASRWEDWPDVIWSLRRGKEGSRFQALGRDVELDWVDLAYAKPTHRVTIARPGWRAGINEVVAAIRDSTDHHVVGVRVLEEMLTGDGEVRHRKWADAIASGDVIARGERPRVFSLPDDPEESLANMIQ